jgi:hypothetical protein
MKRGLLLIPLMLVAIVAGAQDPSAMGDYKDLRLLYVGHPGSAREAAFVDFLKRYFTTVNTGDLASFREVHATGYDVVLFDYDGDGFKAPRLRLSQDYTRSTVALGVVGAFICGNLRLKAGYV